MDNGVTRRAFVIHMGAAAALLGGAAPAPAQTAPAPMAGKEKLIVRSPRPINLETPLGQLGADITPTELFFVRNNYDGPEIDSAQYVLKVQGEVDNPLSLRLDDLRRMEQVTQTVTLECAGNGRAFYAPKAAGIQWEHGAVGTGVWKGVRLADVLRMARPRPGVRPVPAGLAGCVRRQPARAVGRQAGGGGRMVGRERGPRSPGGALRWRGPAVVGTAGPQSNRRVDCCSCSPAVRPASASSKSCGTAG